MKGKITKIISDKNFFFVDNEYFCHFDRYSETPELDDIVEYERSEKNGKRNALSVKLIKKANSFIEDYFNELEAGYFEEKETKQYLKRDFIIKYPMELAKSFSAGDKNKAAQVAKFYYNIKHIESIYRIRGDFNYTSIELSKLIPIAVKSRERNHITKDFEQFLILNIQMATLSKENFIDGFIPHFQSIICYY